MGECLTGDRPMNWDEITKELKKPLSPSNVKGRQQSGRKVSYVESWHIINEANRIFGFNEWDMVTVYCKEVCRYEVSIGKDNPKPGWKVGYEAKVQVSVWDDGAGGSIKREGTGHGSASMTDLFDCIESAAKEAESDALKRAFRTFGNQFGLALYDKTQANVGDEPEPVPEPLPKALQEGVALYQKMKGDKENAQSILDEHAMVLVGLEALSKAGDERAHKTFEAICKLVDK